MQTVLLAVKISKTFERLENYHVRELLCAGHRVIDAVRVIRFWVLHTLVLATFCNKRVSFVRPFSFAIRRVKKITHSPTRCSWIDFWRRTRFPNRRRSGPREVRRATQDSRLSVLCRRIRICRGICSIGCSPPTIRSRSSARTRSLDSIPCPPGKHRLRKKNTFCVFLTKPGKWTNWEFKVSSFLVFNFWRSFFFFYRLNLLLFLIT